jgi:hypothetical protein
MMKILAQIIVFLCLSTATCYSSFYENLLQAKAEDDPQFREMSRPIILKLNLSVIEKGSGKLDLVFRDGKLMAPGAAAADGCVVLSSRDKTQADGDLVLNFNRSGIMWTGSSEKPMVGIALKNYDGDYFACSSLPPNGSLVDISRKMGSVFITLMPAGGQANKKSEAPQLTPEQQAEVYRRLAVPQNVFFDTQ